MSQKLHNFPKTALTDNKISSTIRYGLVGGGVLLVIAIIVSIVLVAILLPPPAVPKVPKAPYINPKPADLPARSWKPSPTAGGKNPPAPIPGGGKPAITGPLYGNWYYGYGAACQTPSTPIKCTGGSLPCDGNCTACGNQVACFLGGAAAAGNVTAAQCSRGVGADDMIMCPVSLADQLAPISGAKENTAFYLGTGFHEGTGGGTAGYGSWKDVQRDIPAENQIINFGGWGCCNTGPNDKVCTVAQASNTYCPSGPNCVWGDTEIGQLPSASDIAAKGYNGVSIDIEGCRNLTGQSVNNKLSSWRGLKRIITLPGNGIHPEFGGMDWFGDVATAGHFDYVCLMYYGLINDTEVKNMGTLTSQAVLLTSLRKHWSGMGSMYNIPPSKIILGFSLGKTTSPAEFLSPNVLELASGGTTRWQERGGAVIIPK